LQEVRNSIDSGLKGGALAGVSVWGHEQRCTACDISDLKWRGLKWRGLLRVDLLACNLDQANFPAALQPEFLTKMGAPH